MESQVGGPRESVKKIQTLLTDLNQIILGQNDLLVEAICALLAGGHLLLTGVPGLAKTTLIKTLGKKLGLVFGRIQFTADLLPGDILGSEILQWDKETGDRSFQFAKGPIFVHLLLADEINRASARAQSALLEAMEENKVTINGKTHHLPKPFMVFATQNPLETEGTFPLPEAQLDRFLFHSLVSYPSSEWELEILENHLTKNPHDSPSQETFLDLATTEHILKEVRSIEAPKEILSAINELVRSTRPKDNQSPIFFGSGPRGALSIIDGSRALAFLQGQTCLSWSHIKRIAFPALRHRIRLTSGGRRDGLTPDHVIAEALLTMEKRYGLTD
jgi:MoxR-like ATPase